MFETVLKHRNFSLYRRSWSPDFLAFSWRENFCFSLYKLRIFKVFVRKWFPYHHVMARPQVPDKWGGLQVWRVAAHILNKQCGQLAGGVPPAWGLGGGRTPPPPPVKPLICYETLQRASDHDWFFFHELSTVKWKWDLHRGTLRTSKRQGHWRQWRRS
jgi:hypothetical protein